METLYKNIGVFPASTDIDGLFGQKGYPLQIQGQFKNY